MKKIKRIAKLNLVGGSARPGAALASLGINMPQFCSDFNNQTKDKKNDLIPTRIIVFADKTFSFTIHTTPVSVYVKKLLELEKASSEPNKNKVAKITKAQIEEVAKYKLVDLNTDSLEVAKSIVSGTIKSMGIEIID